MKDRKFIAMLALVVAAGLAMGLVAFRVTAGKNAGAGGAATSNTAADTRPAAKDSEPDQPVQPVEQPATADVDSGEPKAPKAEAPEMLPPSSGDAPGTAAAEPAQPGAPQAASGDAVQ